MNWTQPICLTCYLQRNPDRLPHAIAMAITEVCSDCGRNTRSGIYHRVNPTTVPYPTKEST